MSRIVDTLLQAQRYNTVAKDLVGKLAGISIAPVYQVFEDDTITVLLPETGARSASPRLYRVLPAWSLTYPAVRVGDTVAYGFIEGNPNKGVYWGVLHNAVNPPDQLDSYSLRVGNCYHKTTPDVLSQYHTELGDGSDTSGIVITGEGLLLEKKGEAGGASITVTDGTIVLKAGSLVITISQTGITVTGGESAAVALSGLTSATINSKEVSTIGATDSDGDVLVDRGW